MRTAVYNSSRGYYSAARIRQALALITCSNETLIKQVSIWFPFFVLRVLSLSLCLVGGCESQQFHHHYLASSTLFNQKWKWTEERAHSRHWMPVTLLHWGISSYTTAAEGLNASDCTFTLAFGCILFNQGMLPVLEDLNQEIGFISVSSSI